MKKIERKDVSDTGVIVALVFILFGLLRDTDIYYKIAIALLFVVLLFPALFKPLAVVWFAVAHFLSRISSSIILTLVYIVVLLPVALLMRLFGKDLLKLRQFKKGKDSVFSHRAYHYTEEDILRPY